MWLAVPLASESNKAVHCKEGSNAPDFHSLDTYEWEANDTQGTTHTYLTFGHQEYLTLRVL